MSEYILEMLDISKSFPGVQALKGVDLKVRPGTVHALMGENGAGKSTLMKCLIGMHPPTSGKIIYMGKEIQFKNVNEALDTGISMIHQELNPVVERSVMENVWLGREPRHGLFIDYKQMRKDTVSLSDMLNMDIAPDTKMGDLSVGKMQMIEIAKAVSYDSSIVIMDEPTSALTQNEANQLFAIIKQLKEKNVAIIYISHKMDEIFEICDEVTIFRDGEFVATDHVKNMTIDKMIRLMVGRELTDMFPKIECPIGEPILRVENLSSGSLFQNVSFEVHRGEILGFAGLVGASRTEIVETIFGLHPITEGKIFIHEEEVEIHSPEGAIAHKIALLTEDRRASGIVGVLGVNDNMTIAKLASYGLPLNHQAMRKDVDEYIQKLNIKTPTPQTRIENLSGGNQQKVLVARWLLTDPDILFVDEPTRGIDVGSKAEIHTLISQLAGQGKAIVMISSEMPEVLGMSDRVLVMHEGLLTGILDRSEATQELVLKYATGEFASS